MPPIRALIFAAVIIMAYAYAVIGFIGSYQIVNNIPLNASLKAQYLAVTGNSVNPSIFTSLNNLTKQGTAQGSQLGGITSLNTVGMVAQSFTSIPAVYSSIAYLVVTPLGSLLGVQNMSVITADLLFLVIILIVLAILSAIFLFPL